MSNHEPCGVNWKCFLFGHTGDQTESGYHVCDRCGMHGYWCAGAEGYDDECCSQYGKAGVILYPYHRAKEILLRIKWKLFHEEPF